MDDKIVYQFAGKLGLSGETKVIDKTKELLRLLQLKGTALPQLGDYAKCVICLDLSTSMYGHEFDSQTALKLSGFKRPSYLNNRRIVEKLLDLNKPMGITEICVQLSLTEIQATSGNRLLEHFVARNDMPNIDTTHPQYAAMVVYQLCRLKKIKIQKTKLISFSHLKPSQWALLEKSWDTWAKNNPDVLKEFQTSSNGAAEKKMRMNIDQPADGDGNPAKELHTGPVIEEFSIWRERILKQAFIDLERLKGK